MERLRAMWARLGRTERIALMVGIPLVAVAAIYSSSRAKKEPAKVEPANPGTSAPQTFGPSPYDFMSIIDQITKAGDDAAKKIDDATKKATTSPVTPPAPAPVGNLSGLAHADLIRRADDVYRTQGLGALGPYETEIIRRIIEQGVGPDGTFSVNDPAWLKPDGKPRAIYYAVGPKIRQVIEERAGT